MQSRRDQVQAQSYVLGRLTCALVSAEPEALENPHRRPIVGMLSGLLIAVLVAAGFGVYGFLVPGGATAWRAPGALIVEKKTGSRYLLVGGRLRPVFNYASARLLLDGEPTVVSVSPKSLRGVAHGQPVGIVDAPDALPAADAAAGQVWTVCARAARDAAGTLMTATTVSVTGERSGALPADQLVGVDEAVVASAEGESYLVWQGRRFRLTNAWLPRVLGYDRAPAVVEAAWLETLPAGPDIDPADVPGRGEAGMMVDGRQARVGEMFVARTDGGPERHYLLDRDGLSPLTSFEYAIVVGDPRTSAVYGGRPIMPTELSPAALARLPVSGRRVLPAVMPERPPRLAAAPPDGAWCVRWTAADGRIELAVASSSGGPGDGDGDGGDAVAPQSAVAPGIGGLVRSGGAGAPGSNLYLVTDAAVKYPLSGAAAAAALGYPPESAGQVPRPLLELLPTGPLLDQDLARR